jgi:hypothetical protein
VLVEIAWIECVVIDGSGSHCSPPASSGWKAPSPTCFAALGRRPQRCFTSSGEGFARGGTGYRIQLC